MSSRTRGESGRPGLEQAVDQVLNVFEAFALAADQQFAVLAEDLEGGGFRGAGFLEVHDEAEIPQQGIDDVAGSLTGSHAVESSVAGLFQGAAASRRRCGPARASAAVRRGPAPSSGVPQAAGRRSP